MSGNIVDSAQVPRGALFLVNIGVPLIVGVLRHQPDGALIGADGFASHWLFPVPRWG